MSEQNGFSHQDWNKIIIGGASKKSNTTNVKPQITQEAKQLKSIENSSEIGKLREINLGDRQIMISMRAAKGLKQDQVAQALSMPHNLYKDIENGKTVPSQQQLNKINNYLKTSIKLT
jgi:ribosome-binding protein aMBF1 (putative translation factor)